MLSDNQERHLNYIKEQFELKVDRKYRRGVMEHGGDLQDMDLLNLVDNSIEEAIDEFVYLTTLREKLLTRLGSKS
jgi:hypothetical protein